MSINYTATISINHTTLEYQLLAHVSSDGIVVGASVMMGYRNVHFFTLLFAELSHILETTVLIQNKSYFIM